MDDKMSCGKESLIQATSVSRGPINGQRLANQQVNTPVNGSMVNVDGRSVKGWWAVDRWPPTWLVKGRWVAGRWMPNRTTANSGAV